MRWASLLVLSLAILPRSSAAVLRVDAASSAVRPDGASWSTAFANVQSAVRAARQGDEIWVAQGTYSESLVLDAPLSLYGGFRGTESARDQRRPQTQVSILDGGYAGPVVVAWSGATVDGFTITGGWGISDGVSGLAAGAVCAPSGVLTVSHCVIVLNYALDWSGGDSSAGGIFAGGDAEIAWNEFIANEGDGVAALYCAGNAPRIHNNTFRDNRAAAVGALLCTGPSALVHDNTLTGNTGAAGQAVISGGLFANNTVASNIGPGLAVRGAGATVAGNIITGNYAGMYLDPEGSPVAVRCNDVVGNFEADYVGLDDPTGRDGNIRLDPLFLHGGPIFHLSADSPCRDAGDDSVVGADWRDADGEPRRMGRHVDIGADERPAAPLGAAIRVSPNGSDQADGLSWPTARRTLAAALDIAFVGNEVWLAGGEYGSGTAPAVSIRAGVGVYGGFAGNESARVQRRPDLYPVTLRDPLGFAPGAGRDTVLDGVTLRANRSTPPALSCSAASPTVSAVAFRGAPVAVRGGASPIFTRCSFTSQSVAGTVSVQDASLALADCAFENDAGILVERSRLSAERCSFGRAPSPAVRATDARVDLLGCDVVWRDAGVQASGAASRLAVSRCTFAALSQDALLLTDGARAEVRSSLFHTNAQAAAVVDGSSLTLVNATIARNGATGGCVRAIGSAQVSLVNTIVASNASGVVGPAMLRKCYVAANGPVPAGSLSGDPRFAAPEFGDFHLQPNSPCRDTGDPSAALPGEADRDGAPRVQGAGVDIGAYESNGTPRASAYRIIRVRPDGSDAADGASWARARKTIAAAIQACPPTGAEIWVAAGVYREAGLVLRPGMRLLGGFAGWEGASSQRQPSRNRSVVEASGAGTVIDAPPEVSRLAVLDGFTFRGPARAVAVSCAGAPTITHNVFAGAGTALAVAGPAVVADNIFVANAGSGGTARPHLPSDILAVSADAVVVNNTLSANEGGVALLSGSPRFENNIVARNGEGVRVAPGCTPAIRANCVWGNAAYAYQGLPDPTGRSGNLAADPGFVDFPHGNLHLQSGSPCANAGLDAAIMTDTDMDGQPRRTKGRVDIGADETDSVLLRQPAAKAIRVRPGGDDRNDGSTWAKARRTLAGAVALAASSGADVWAAAGVYPESLVLPPFVAVYGGFRGAEYALGQRRPGESLSVIRPAPGAPAVQFRGARAPCTLDGFVIDGPDVPLPVRPTGVPAFSGAVHSIDASPTLAHCDLRGGGFASAGGMPRLLACRIEGSVACAEGTPYVAASLLGGGIALYEAHATVSSNAVSGSSGSGLFVFNGGAWVTNNTIAANARGVLLRGAARVTLANNAIVFNGSGLSADATVTLDARFNNVYGNAGQSSPTAIPGAGNVAVDPLLMDVTHNDLRPRAGSPLIDAGDAAFVPPGVTDVDGRPRLAGASVDIGAYESDGRPPRPLGLLVVRVSPAGSDSGDGSTWRTAKRTLSAALDTVRREGGGEVWAAAGVYAGPVVLGPFVSLYGGFAGWEARLSERVPSSGATIIDAGRAGCAVTALYGFRSSVVDGCTLRNGTARYELGAWRPGAADLGAAVFTHNTVFGCYSYYNASLRAWSGAAGVRSSRGALITDNVIASNYGVGIWAGSACEVRRNRILGNTADNGAGLTVSGAGTLVESNVFTGNSAAYAGGALYVDDRSVDTRCVNNTIVANAAPSAGAAAILSPATLANNIVMWNTSGIDAPTAVLTHNNVWDNGRNYEDGADPTGQDGNLSADPLFVNGPDGDYRLLPDSPCLDAGLDAAVPPDAADITGSPRIRGLHVDMGACER